MDRWTSESPKKWTSESPKKTMRSIGGIPPTWDTAGWAQAVRRSAASNATRSRVTFCSLPCPIQGIQHGPPLDETAFLRPGLRRRDVLTRGTVVWRGQRPPGRSFAFLAWNQEDARERLAKIFYKLIIWPRRRSTARTTTAAWIRSSPSSAENSVCGSERKRSSIVVVIDLSRVTRPTGIPSA